MIVATAAYPFVNKIPIESGEQAARAIEPLQDVWRVRFAFGIHECRIYGNRIIGLSTTYAFSEFLVILRES